MAFFKKKKEEPAKEAEKLEENLRDDISKAYDELVSGGANESDGDASDNQTKQKPNAVAEGSFESALLKARIDTFHEKKDQESLLDLLKTLPGKKFLLPSVSNMKEPFERDGEQMKLKKGAVLNPALLSSKDNKIFLPIFTEEREMKQKSPSGITLKFSFEQCVGIVYNKKNPVTAIVINPFTNNFIIGEELLRQFYKERPKNA